MSPPSLCFAFAGKRILLSKTEGGFAVPDLMALEAAAAGSTMWDADVTLPAIDGRGCRAFGLTSELEAPPGFALLGLRELHAYVPPEVFRVAGTARQTVEWIRTHGFCSRCGGETRRHAEHRAMECGTCGQLHFPRVAPAVIVLIEREREMLLARSSRFTPGVYSTLAGFVEPGESLEEAVHREVMEEVGVAVTDLRYFGSQPWPFPHSLMVGFTARWDGGEIRADPAEIEDAGWFSAEDLPTLPTPFSIARRLVDDFLARTAHPDDG